MGAASTTGERAIEPTGAEMPDPLGVERSLATHRLESGIHRSASNLPAVAPDPAMALVTPAGSLSLTVTAKHLPFTGVVFLEKPAAILLMAGSMSGEATTWSATVLSPQVLSRLMITYAATPSSTASATAPARGTSTLPRPARRRPDGSL